MNTVQYKLIAQDRKANPALRCLAIDILEDMEKLDEEVKKKFIKPLSTENPFIKKMGLDINEYPVLTGLKTVPKSKSEILAIGKHTKLTFKLWLGLQNVKLKPKDKRYSKYYQRYKREVKNNNLLK